MNALSAETARVARVFPPSLRKSAAAYLYLAPVFLVLLIVVAWPLVEAMWMSLHECYLLKGLDVDRFVGLDNYVTFFRDPRTWVFMNNTAIYVVGTVVGDIVVGLTLALLLHRHIH